MAHGLRALILGSAALCGGAVLVSGRAFAGAERAASAVAAAADLDGSPEEITVTAQKRVERLGDVPISVTAVTGDQLSRQGITQPADLTRVVPGFTYQRTSWNTPVFSVRGIGIYTTFAAIAPAVSVYVDQIPLPYLVMTPGVGLDLERVEVLKGPQGTLFGQNSTGGAVNYIAAKPTKELKAGFDATYGRFNQASIEAFLSGPLSNSLAARVAVRHDSGDGWQRSVSRPGDRLGRRDFTEGRLLVDWDANDRLKFELNINGYLDRSETQAAQFNGFCAAGGAASGTPCVGGLPSPSAAILAGRSPLPKDAMLADWDPGKSFAMRQHMMQFALTGTYQVTDDLALTSLTSYAHFKTTTPNDADGTEFSTFGLTVLAKIKTFSQELRLAGDLNDRINFTVGGNYQHDVANNDDIGYFDSTNSGVAPTLRFNSFTDRADQRVSTVAAFASVDYKLTDTLTTQTGIRYTDQHRKFSGCLLDGTAGNQLGSALDFLHFLFTGNNTAVPPGSCLTFLNTTNFDQGLVTNHLNQDNVSWRLGLNWKPSRDVLVYGNVTKGYKSGAVVALPATTADEFIPVTQESVLAYEVGTKLSPTHALQFSAAAFYYDYRNKQLEDFVNVPIFGNVPAFRNIPKSRVVGGEANIQARLFDGLTVALGGTYVNSKVTRSFIGSDPIGTNFDFKGLAFPSTPKWQLTGDVQYDFPISGSLNGYVGGNVVHHSKSYSAFAVNNDPRFLLNSYWLLDLRAGVQTADEKIRLQVWGRNVTNTYYLVHAYRYPDAFVRLAGMPATYGVTLSYRY